MKLPLKVLVPDVPNHHALVDYIKRIDESHWYTNFGPLVTELENKVRDDFYPDMNVVSVSSATLGLELALSSFGLRPGAKVLMPSLSFPATAGAAIRCGFVPLYADVDPDTWAMTPEIAYRALKAGHSIDAVMPVCPYGAVPDMAAWDEFAEQTRLPVVLDAAAAFGNPLAAKRVISVISLHATKSLPAGEGGLVLVPHEFRATSIRRASNFGIDTTLGNMLAMLPGTNAKMSEYHAAVALAALTDWESRATMRRELNVRYERVLSKRVQGVYPQIRNLNGVYNTFTALLPPTTTATHVGRVLKSFGVETRAWYCPPQHQHPGLSHGVTVDDLPVTMAIARRLIGLPFHAALRQSNFIGVDYVVDRIKDAIA